MKKKTLLVAVDGSQNAMNAVRYTAKVVKPGRVSVHLLHVMSPVPETFWDDERDPAPTDFDKAFRKWENAQHRFMERFVDEARTVLLEAGISGNDIGVDIKPRERGVARDIANEAQRGYDAVVLGRRGTNPAVELPIGSVASKIANTLHHFTVWIVAGPPERGKTLVAMDGSRNALRALDHACDMLHLNCPGICLCHVIREAVGQVPKNALDRDDETERFLLEMNHKRLEKAETAMGRCFIGGVEQLKSSGFEVERIVTRIITGAASRAGAVVREAKENGYRTIILGRRGINPEEDFFMGRVCSKVLQMAQDITVWIVN
jgi:nucleotide-binding universal stress UspA family protein